MAISETNRNIIADLRGRLEEAGMAAELRLFGACVRGDEEADLDLCLIFDSVDASLIEQVHALTWAVGFDHGVTICPLVVSQGELEHPSVLMQQIRTTGILV